MVKCSKADRAAEEEDTGCAAPTHPDGALAREWDDAARDSGCDGRISEHGKPRAHAYDDGRVKALKPKPIGGRKHENMTLAEEKALLRVFAKGAAAGEC